MNWKIAFSERIKELTGCNIETKYIFSDERGWSFYICKNSLTVNHPLIMSSYDSKGSTIAIIPHADYNKLEKGEIFAREYIDEAFWNFGFLWGDYFNEQHEISLMDGVFWQPLESIPGINEKEKVQKYIYLMEQCRKEALFGKGLYVRTTSELEDVIDMKKEFNLQDDRIAIMELLTNKIKNKFNEPKIVFKELKVHNQSANLAILVPKISDSNCFDLFLSTYFLNAILYCPGADWSKFIDDTLQFKYGISCKKGLLKMPDKTIDEILKNLGFNLRTLN